jgi:UDP-glucose 4-epimerase
METQPATAQREHTLSDTRVLVTGGAGFIGSHLVESLVEDNTVRVLDALTSGNRESIHPDATVYTGDIRDRRTVSHAMDGVDVVFHQAGFVSVDGSIEDPAKSHSVNVGGTQTVLDCARQHDARVVLASSAAVYGHPETVPIPETASTEPTSPYGIDKLAADHYARRFADLYGLPTVALRYFNVYGPRQSAASYSGVISTFLDQARAGTPLTIDGDGSQTRDFVHVSDVVRANRLAATTPHTGEAFNVGTGQKTSIATLARTITSIAGVDDEFVYRDPRPGDIDHSRAETQKAREMLGFEASVDLATGLESLLEPRKSVRH